MSSYGLNVFLTILTIIVILAFVIILFLIFNPRPPPIVINPSTPPANTFIVPPSVIPTNISTTTATSNFIVPNSNLVTNNISTIGSTPVRRGGKLNQTCDTDNDCDSYLVCQAGFCQHLSNTSVCNAKIDCTQGNVCIGTVTGSKCLAVSDQPCATNSHCLSGSCVEDSGIIYIRDKNTGAWIDFIDAPSSADIIKITSIPNLNPTVNLKGPERDDTLYILSDFVYKRENQQWVKIIPTSAPFDASGSSYEIIDMAVLPDGTLVLAVNVNGTNALYTIDNDTGDLVLLDDLSYLSITNLYNLQANASSDILFIANNTLYLKAHDQSQFEPIMDNVKLVGEATLMTSLSRAHFYSGQGSLGDQSSNIAYVTFDDPDIIQFMGAAEGAIYPANIKVDNILDFASDSVASQSTLDKRGSNSLYILSEIGDNQQLTAVLNGVESNIPGYFNGEATMHVSSSGRLYIENNSRCS